MKTLQQRKKDSNKSFVICHNISPSSSSPKENFNELHWVVIQNKPLLKNIYTKPPILIARITGPYSEVLSKTPHASLPDIKTTCYALLTQRFLRVSFETAYLIPHIYSLQIQPPQRWQM